MTHVSAILGLSEIMGGQTKVLSVNGKTGAVIITRQHFRFTDLTAVLLSGEEYDKITQIQIMKQVN